MSDQGVLLVASQDDAHASVMHAALENAGVCVAQFDLAEAARLVLDVVPGQFVQIGEDEITTGWTVWWRRAGVPAPAVGIPVAEATLAVDETRDIVLGGLLSLGLRWVDEPYTVLRAEQTLLQLVSATAVDIRVPPSRATSSPATGKAFLSDGPAVAKAISAGAGLAPYADGVSELDLELLHNAPTFLQRRLEVRADIRVVVVGAEALCWRRTRSDGEPLDWRAADPGGRGFVAVNVDDVGEAAMAIRRRLGLSFGVQDWVIEADGRPTFLEVNPCGAWLFLDGAHELVVPRLVHHLTSEGASCGD